MEHICIIGAGYVGISTALVINSQFNGTVTVSETNPNKRELLQQQKTHLHEQDITNALKTANLNIVSDFTEVFDICDHYIICVGTPKSDNGGISTSLVQELITKLAGKHVYVRSTIQSSTITTDDVIHIPEFVREGHCYNDAMNPHRIIVGHNKPLTNEDHDVIQLLAPNNCNIHYMSTNESVLAKLFGNVYLASRIALFNELDSLCLQQNLDTKTIINAICDDPRMGHFYNNPGFGFSGYCLPKDCSEYAKNSALATQYLKSNEERISTIIEHVKRNLSSTDILGIYRLNIKKDSDNTRYNVIEQYLNENTLPFKCLIYEPLKNTNYSIQNATITHDLHEVKVKSKLILANRLDDELNEVKHKVFSRDIFYKDE